MMLLLAITCAALLIMEKIASAASIDLLTHQSEIGVASDAKTASSSRFRLQLSEVNAVRAMIRAFPSLGSLPGMFNHSCPMRLQYYTTNK